MQERPVAIEVRDVRKSFRLMDQGALSLKARATELFRRHDEKRLHVLGGVSFDIHQGEFFGITGRNGSGKSTLLKLISSIYRVDQGTIRIAGRLAPFIELGVGFDGQMTAHDNVVINAVMMGLSPAEAEERFDEIMDYAELTEYADVPLRNYSSGMFVRLSFAVMVHVDADILLVDEVFAVGDARFQKKCEQTLRRMQAEGRTIVLVSHSMPSIREFCDRALLLEAGHVFSIGDADTVAARYEEILELGSAHANISAFQNEAVPVKL